MFDLVFAVESFKRRWVIVVAVTLVAAAAGVIWPSLSKGEVVLTPTYTAEATIYMDGYESDDVNEYNYQVSESYLVNDARRIVVSDSVAGSIRRDMGDDITISSPYWMDRKTKGNLGTHFIFVDAAADSESKALEAANEAANKAVALIGEQLRVSKVDLFEEAVIKTVTGEAGDFGIDGLEVAPIEGVTSSFNPKMVALFAIAGFVVALVGVLLFDLLRRRIRTPHDIERLLGVPLLGVVKSADSHDSAAYSQAALTIDSLCRKNEVKTLVVCGMIESDEAESLGAALDQTLKCGCIDGAATLAPSKGNLASVASADCVVLSVAASAATAAEIDEATRVLKTADVPILGAVFLSKSRM